MKIKALLLSAALGAVMVSSASAQVYSENTVGYVNKSLAAGFHILSIPLSGSPDNNLNNTLPLETIAAGANIYRFNPVTQAYGSPITWAGANYGGWFPTSGNPADAVVAPGEGFFLQLLVPQTITFVGEVMQGDLSNPLQGAGLTLTASQVPQTGNLTELEFDAANLDVVWAWNGSGYVGPWTFATGFGWVDPVDFTNLDGPTIDVGTGFFLVRSADVDLPWTRTFNVNN